MTEAERACLECELLICDDGWKECRFVQIEKRKGEPTAAVAIHLDPEADARLASSDARAAYFAQYHRENAERRNQRKRERYLQNAEEIRKKNLDRYYASKREQRSVSSSSVHSSGGAEKVTQGR